MAMAARSESDPDVRIQVPKSRSSLNALRMAIHADKPDDSTDVSERLTKLEQEIADVEETLEIKVAKMERLKRELGMTNDEKDSRVHEVNPPPLLRSQRPSRSPGLFSSPLFNAVASLGCDISEMVRSQFGCQRRYTVDTPRSTVISSIQETGRTPSREGLLHQVSTTSNGPTKHRSFADPPVTATLVAIEEEIANDDPKNSLTATCKQSLPSSQTTVAFPAIIGKANDTYQRL